MKFAFIAKHRGLNVYVQRPVNWMCEALGVSRSGFFAWLNRPQSERARSDVVLGRIVRDSFERSDRTYGARRIWHDVLAEGFSCGLHRVERLMRACVQGPAAPAAPAERRRRALDRRRQHP